ncbi:MAG: ion channel [Bacteroidota bacterium]|jgi:inward rectifier potassium channel
MLGRKNSFRGKENTQTGLSANGSLSGGRFFNKDGSANLSYSGLPFWEKMHLYHSLLSLTNLQFIVFIVLFFVGVNLLFAGLYLLIGLDHLGGLVATTAGEKFGEAFFFSAQTFTTVGYGRINPIGFAASLVASLEALAGLMSFALLTGLLYGRFSRPKAFIRFSNSALIAPYQDGVAWMCRLVTHTKNVIMNAEVGLTLAIRVEEQGVVKNKFYSLPLEIAKINVLSGSWTLVHAIREGSPLMGLSAEDFEAGKAEFLVFLQGFDEAFSNTVVTRSSYTWEELVFGARFVPMFHPNEKQNGTLVHVDRLSAYEHIELPKNMVTNQD